MGPQETLSAEMTRGLDKGLVMHHLVGNGQNAFTQGSLGHGDITSGELAHADHGTQLALKTTFVSPVSILS